MTIQGPFYIWFEKSGGFAGISTSVEIDSELLSSGELKELKQLIDQSGFFEWEKSDSIPVAMPDQFHYKITIAHEGKKQTAGFSDLTVPDSFRPLIKYLSNKARSKKE